MSPIAGCLNLRYIERMKKKGRGRGAGPKPHMTFCRKLNDIADQVTEYPVEREDKWDCVSTQESVNCDCF